MSGKEPVFTGQPVPLYNTVYQWLQRHASREMGRAGCLAADEVNPNPLPLPVTGGAAASNHSGLTCVLAAALKHILRNLCYPHQYRTILLLSAISPKILSLAQADVHYKQATNLRPGGDVDVDAFVRSKSDWILDKLQVARERRTALDQARVVWADGARFEVLGEAVRLRLDAAHGFSGKGAALVDTPDGGRELRIGLPAHASEAMAVGASISATRMEPAVLTAATSAALAVVRKPNNVLAAATIPMVMRFMVQILYKSGLFGW
jgi:hypothetical protein